MRRMIQLRTMTVFVSLSATALGAQAAMGPDGPSGATSKPVDDNTSLASILKKIQRKQKIPAIAAAVVRDGKTIAVAAAGVRKARGKNVVTAEDRFHLGSCTKSMTATLCAMLVEQGKLKWDSTVGDVFAAVKEKIDPGFRDVTLAQLLCHRSGLPEDRAPDLIIFPKVMLLTGELPARRREMVEIVLGRPPAAKPGSAYAYANFGFAVAGAMCESVTGEAYEALMQRMLFEPLGITSAGFGAPGSADSVDQPRGHQKLLAWYSSVAPGPGSDNPQAIAPAGTAHMAMGDWAKYAALHLDAARGKLRLLSAASFSRLHSDPYDQDYGFGWLLAEKHWADGTILAHDGSNGRWYAIVVIAPKKNAAFLVATNAASEAAIEGCRMAVEWMRKKFLLGE
ncbi:MAG TPA: serine hydrolase domain-containing protein [Phycisphaerae bacterium]|nr:serine hydrolase domain-containing protein [Phycisphaerae bacterium]